MSFQVEERSELLATALADKMMLVLVDMLVHAELCMLYLIARVANEDLSRPCWFSRFYIYFSVARFLKGQEREKSLFVSF